MLPRMTIKSTYLIALVSGYFMLVLNWAFFLKVYTYLFSLDEIHPGFLIAVPVLVYIFLFILFSLLVIKGLTKLLLIPLVILSAVVSYAAIHYGIIIDYLMIENVIETDAAEVSSYVNPASIAYVTALGLIPAWLLYKTEICYQRWYRELLTRAGLVAAMAVALAGVTFGYYQDFAAAGRNNHHIHKLIVPNQWAYSAAKFINRTYFHQPYVFQELGNDAHLVANSEKPVLLVLVLGETARAKNYHYNGYTRQTNPYTEARGFISLGSIESCGTATALSVPCMFSFMTRNQYDKSLAENQSNLLDVIRKSGMDVRWVDNNSGCKGVCGNAAYVKIPTDKSRPGCDGDYCVDEVLLGELDRLLETPLTNNTVLVLHLIGSHGPNYYRRYPDRYRRFVPDCERSDIQNCSQEQIVNTYDNTILYTDFLLSRVADRLQQQAGQLESGVLYMSDHGESLGENGLYLHGMPWQLAPAEQKRVPGLLWLSGNYLQDHRLSLGCLSQIRQRSGLTQDYYAHSVLGLLGIATSIYDPLLDITQPCHIQAERRDIRLSQKQHGAEHTHS